ncbi:MAG: hypothetical protein DGJ47_000103 [Rickettsiaceae bacterium]
MNKKLIGLGLRQENIADFYNESPPLGWVEVHSENYTNLCGSSFDYLIKIREKYKVSLHGIGMSLGSYEKPDKSHLQQIKALVDLIDPFLLSEHLSWSATSDKYLPDLIPIPYNQESFDIFSRNLSIAQEYLGRELLIENPSSYFEYKDSVYSETSFINKLCNKTGARLLLDVNNVYVSSQNNNFSAISYINNIDHSHVSEIHLAGHTKKQIDNNKSILIDTHNDYVSKEVWELFQFTLSKCGPVPSLLEWDTDLPPLKSLLHETNTVNSYLNEATRKCTV